MQDIAARLGNHVNSRALGFSIRCRETLCADLEFFHGFKWKLHHRPANSVVLVIDTVDGHVDIATVLAIDGENRITIFGRVIGICCFHTGSQVRQISDVPSNHRKFFDFFRSDLLADIGFVSVQQWNLAGDFHDFCCATNF